MTREEAIEIIRDIDKAYRTFTKTEIQALEMAIKALEQEPTTKNDLGVDCISRKAVLDAIDSKAWEFCDYLISKGRNDEQKPVSHFADNLRECVREELPSATPQPIKGHWIEHEHNGIAHIECSECSSWFLRPHLIRNRYCPNCGAKMTEKEE